MHADLQSHTGGIMFMSYDI